MKLANWLPTIRETGQPRYIALALAIGEDVASGRLKPGERLPPQRKLAEALGFDISLVSRAYSEAARRGYVESQVGRGTFVIDETTNGRGPDPRRTLEEDPRMNMPPEIADPRLIKKMQQGLEHVASNMVPLLRYQSATGGAKDREVSLDWLQANGHRASAENLTITPGAHAAIKAALMVARPTRCVVLCEPVTYPGIRAITSQLGLDLVPLDEDEKGITPASLERAAHAHPNAVLYLNPTLRNPSTHTIPGDRRVEIANVLRAHGMPLVEDDAYGLVATQAPEPISNLVPDLAWHILGVSKAFGAGLRLAYATAPNREQLSDFVQAIRATHVMTSPLCLALLSTWIEEGTADDMLADVRRLARRRQDIAAEILRGVDFDANEEAYNIWLKIPNGLTRAETLARVAGGPLGVMPSDVFTVNRTPEERLRVCLGGPMSENELREGLHALKSALHKQDWSG